MARPNDLKRALSGDKNLSEADLRGADLRGADLREADLTEADLRGADLRGADLTDAELPYSELEDADFRGAVLKGANFFGADLEEAKLDSHIRVASRKIAQIRRGAYAPDPKKRFRITPSAQKRIREYFTEWVFDEDQETRLLDLQVGKSVKISLDDGYGDPYRQDYVAVFKVKMTYEVKPISYGNVGKTIKENSLFTVHLDIKHLDSDREGVYFTPRGISRAIEKAKNDDFEEA